MEPPKKPSNPSLWLEWLLFREKSVTDFVQWQLKLLRSVNEQFLIGTNMPECGPIGSALLGQGYWEQAKGMDYVGTDIYSYCGDAYKEEKTIGYCCDVIRSVAKYTETCFWISETPGGPHFSPWRFCFADGAWGTDFMERSVLQYIKQKAERILFFLWRAVPGGSEFGMNGLAEMDGSMNERTGKIADMLQKAGEWAAEKAKPVAYIHYSKDSLMLAAGFDPDKGSERSLHGWYNLLTDCGFDVEFLNDEGLCGEQWSGDEMLVLPYSMVLDEKTANAIHGIAEKGVQLLAGFGLGIYNSHGCCNLTMPGFGLDELFGFRLYGVDHLDESKQACIGGLNGIKVGMHRGIVELKKAGTVAFSNDNKPLVLKNKNLLYFAFDIGEIYQMGGYNRGICDWFKEIL